MPVGHLKLNNPNVDPNPDITFIRELKQKPNSEKARQLLDAVAAQFKPITKKFGFGVNSFEEYEWNPEFSGRNWNGGEVIELVLRNRDDSFKPYSSILSTMCHELAHIKEMNHSKYFWEKNNEIRGELHQLRANGYFGDGFWSAGTMLTGANVPGQILKEEDQPMYPCGGAINRRRKRQRRNPRNNNDERGGSRRERGSVSKLGHTGRQTRIQRKPGGRVTREGAFKGEGKVMDDDPEMSTFRRRANAPSAIAARADAAQRRMEMDKVAKKKKEQASKKFKTDLSLDIKPKLKDDAKEKGKGKEMVNELEIIDLCDSSDDEKAREGDGTDDLDEIEDGDSDEEPDTDDEEFEFEDPGMQITDEAELAQIKAEVFAEDDFILSSGTAAGGSGTNKKPPAPFAQAPSASAPLNKNSQAFFPSAKSPAKSTVSKSSQAKLSPKFPPWKAKLVQRVDDSIPHLPADIENRVKQPFATHVKRPRVFQDSDLDDDSGKKSKKKSKQKAKPDLKAQNVNDKTPSESKSSKGPKVPIKAKLKPLDDKIPIKSSSGKSKLVGVVIKPRKKSEEPKRMVEISDLNSDSGPAPPLPLEKRKNDALSGLLDGIDVNRGHFGYKKEVEKKKLEGLAKSPPSHSSAEPNEIKKTLKKQPQPPLPGKKPKNINPEANLQNSDDLVLTDLSHPDFFQRLDNFITSCETEMRETGQGHHITPVKFEWEKEEKKEEEPGWEKEWADPQWRGPAVRSDAGGSGSNT